MKILGISDEVTVCECCGRANLKRTVALSTGDSIVHYGTACAAKATGRKESAVKAEAVGAMESAYRRAARDFEDALRRYCRTRGVNLAVAYSRRGEYEATPEGAALADKCRAAYAAWRAA